MQALRGTGTAVSRLGRWLHANAALVSFWAVGSVVVWLLTLWFEHLGWYP